ncbi:hypothetical protein VTN00DRAFT_402 [Thermoascus crustaceus]|uniref:uncharacterized protein n=1 Tax=Thermoascus crustaceus TaxID=5088 RepID=UPI003742A718
MDKYARIMLGAIVALTWRRYRYLVAAQHAGRCEVPQPELGQRRSQARYVASLDLRLFHDIFLSTAPRSSSRSPDIGVPAASRPP